MLSTRRRSRQRKEKQRWPWSGVCTHPLLSSSSAKAAEEVSTRRDVSFVDMFVSDLDYRDRFPLLCQCRKRGREREVLGRRASTAVSNGASLSFPTMIPVGFLRFYCARGEVLSMFHLVHCSRVYWTCRVREGGVWYSVVACVAESCPRLPRTHPSRAGLPY